MKGIDLYSGIGGWTLGMKFSGLVNINSYEWNQDSIDTHNLNFDTDLEIVDIRKLKLTDLPKPEEIDFVVGSPPCTQFSYSNRGGSGDISDGLVDIFKFLEVVEYLKPKFWVMENVPRVKKIIDEIVDNDKNFKRFKPLIKYNEVVDVSQYGVPQKRKRMICGDFPFEIFLGYKGLFGTRTLGEVITGLKRKPILDPNYQIILDEVFDHTKEKPLTKTETRINRNNKTSHHIYNKMSFPDQTHLPSRTITSTCTRVSRESIIVEEDGNYRRLTLREKGCIQGFPINFQFYGKTYSSKEKMIGNSIPPILTYLLFESMKRTPKEELILPDKIGTREFPGPLENPKNTPPPVPKRKYVENRGFRFTIPNLRLGSGVRFELNNRFNNNQWGITFFYGNSKSVYELELNLEVKKYLEETLNTKLERYFQGYETLLKLNSEDLQRCWTNSRENYYPFEVLDKIGEMVVNLLEKIETKDTEKFYLLFEGRINNKIIQNFETVLCGLIIGSTINHYIDNEG